MRSWAGSQWNCLRMRRFVVSFLTVLAAAFLSERGRFVVSFLAFSNSSSCCIFAACSRDSLLAECQNRDRKISGTNPGKNGLRVFFSRVNCLCWPLFGFRSIPVLPQWRIKDPGHSAESAGGRLHLNMHIPLTQRSCSGVTMTSRHSVGTYQGNELTRSSSGNTRP